jgi:hypothetical protein
MLLLFLSLVTISTSFANNNLPCSIGQIKSITCINKTHYERRDLKTQVLCDISACRFDFSCISNSCQGNSISDHLPRAADYQIVESVPVAQFNNCSSSHANDVAAGYMLCDVLHSTQKTMPTFGHILGNTWVSFGFGPNATEPECSSSPKAWRSCFGANLAAQVQAFQGESPEILFSGGLMEFLTSVNVDFPDQFPNSYCVKGTIGQWGDNTTCVPDVTLQLVQEYYIDWGKRFLDAGIRAIFFGQADLTGGHADQGADGVSPTGALGFATVINELRAYAVLNDYGSIFFAPQAAAGILLPNGTQIADWVYGAQHLQPQRNGSFLTLPLMKNGSYVWNQYGQGDQHDASRHNAGGSVNGYADSLPTVLDYDNFSGDPNVYDDIRRLASWPNATRATLVANHYRWLRAYSGGKAVISIPISKWLAVPQECQCYNKGSINIWGAGNIYFSAYSCSLLDIMIKLWGNITVSPFNEGVETFHLGQQLISSDDTVVAVYAAVLKRNVSSNIEYINEVATLPPRMPSAIGERCDFIIKLLQSIEFGTSVCPNILGPYEEAFCTVDAAMTAILLRDPTPEEGKSYALGLVNGSYTISSLSSILCAQADAIGVYS